MLGKGIVPAENMLPEVAYVKLAWVLGQTTDPGFAQLMVGLKKFHVFLRYNTKQEVTMKKNMGCVDRGIRLVAAIAIVVLIVLKVFSGTLLIVLGIVAAVFLITSTFGFCPLYVPLRISTIPKKKE